MEQEQETHPPEREADLRLRFEEMQVAGHEPAVKPEPEAMQVLSPVASDDQAAVPPVPPGQPMRHAW